MNMAKNLMPSFEMEGIYGRAIDIEDCTICSLSILKKEI